MPPPEIIKKHFVVRGWELRRKPRCPECVKKKEKKMSKAPNLTPVPSSEIVAPSEAARRARRMVYMALEDYYDEAKKAYKPGYSDKKISEETGASETIVSQIRQQDFGPLGPPSEFAEIYASVTELKARLDKLAVAKWLERLIVTNPEVLHLARKTLLESKVWGITCERAIASGQWDEGSIMKEQIRKAEEHMLRNPKETD
jgi:hypothetical protein